MTKFIGRIVQAPQNLSRELGVVFREASELNDVDYSFFREKAQPPG